MYCFQLVQRRRPVTVSVHAVYAKPGTHQKDGVRLLIRMCSLDLNGRINKENWVDICICKSVMKK